MLKQSKHFWVTLYIILLVVTYYIRGYVFLNGGPEELLLTTKKSFVSIAIFLNHAVRETQGKTP